MIKPPTFIELKTPEVKRIYRFPNNESVVIENVKKIAVLASGTHQLESSDGRKYIVSRGWLSIELETAEWTF